MGGPPAATTWSEFRCTLFLGLGQMFMMTGFLCSTSMLESLLHSTSARDPDRVDAHAGYYGQAITYVVYTVSNLITPSLVHLIGSKRLLLMAASVFLIYQLSFFYIQSYLFYGCAALLGFGYAIFHGGHGAYLAEHSKRDSIERNTARVLALSCCSMIVGGLILLTTSLTNENAHLSANATIESYRNFSDREIYFMFSSFSFLSVVAFVLFASLPRLGTEGNLWQSTDVQQNSFWQNIVVMVKAMGNPRMIFIGVSAISNGMFNSFQTGVFPTVFMFTKSLSGYRYLPALSIALIGLGDAIMGAFLSTMTKCVRNFGLFHSLAIGCALCALNYTLIYFAFPEWATVRPTDEPSRFIEPTVGLCLLISFLFGLSDACIFTSRTVMCALALPGRRAQAYAISKFYQSLSSSVLFFCSPFVPVSMYVLVLLVGMTIGGAGHFIAAVSIVNEEREVRVKSRSIPIPGFHGRGLKVSGNNIRPI